MKFSEAFALVLAEEEKSDFTAFRNFHFCVRENEGTIPHFHFYEGQKGHSDIEGCLCIQKRSYFDHGRHKGRLPSKVLAYIYDWLSYDENYLKVAKQWNEISRNNPVALKIKIYDENGKIINPFNNKK